MAAGKKLFEVRVNDRDYQVGDTFTSYRQKKPYRGSELSGEKLEGVITYVLFTGFGLPKNVCVFTVELNAVDIEKGVSYDPDNYLKREY